MNPERRSENLWNEGGWTPREKGLVAAVGVLVLVLTGVGMVLWTGGDQTAAEPELQSYNPQSKEAAPQKEDKADEPTELVVDVKGEVKKPGVYRFSPGARVEEAVRKAGGPGKGADMNQVNLAQALSDGMALYIPAKGEEVPAISAGASGSGGSGDEGGQTVNINTATSEELQQLNGIGPSKAEAIIQYREENGAFSSADELIEVPGIGEKTLETLQDQVTVQ